MSDTVKPWIENARTQAKENQRKLLDSINEDIRRESSFTPEQLQDFGERMDAWVEAQGDDGPKFVNSYRVEGEANE